MKPKAVDPQMWNEIYEVYVKDKYQLNLKEYFSRQNPAALQEITAVMMEQPARECGKPVNSN
mgnify:CR=1 FL=1